MSSLDNGSGASRSSKGAIGFAIALVVLALIIAAVFFVHPPAMETGSSTTVVPQARIGVTKHIGSAAASMGIACLTTRPKFDDMQAAGRAGNFAKIRSDIDDAAILHPGDGVRVLERFGPSGKYAKIAVISGGAVGRVCFTEIDAPNFLK